MRPLLLLVFVLAGCCARLGLAAPDPADAPRPNVIFIITDDQRWDALGCVQREQGARALFPWFETPHLDRLASEGARFRNAFVVHSLCSPSRASFLSGRYTHEHSVRHNWEPLPVELDTWAHGLQQSGYHTAYFGKWHMGQQPERPGFETIYSYVGQGRYNNCVFLENGIKVRSTGWVDDATTDRAIAFLEQEHDRPFGMVIGYKSPHEPRRPPDRREDDFANVELTVPASHHVIPPFRPKGFKPLKWETRIHDRKNYFRCLAAIDDCVGRVLDTLDAQELSDDTVIVFVGDNGYYLGEHASHDKRSAYEESIRIPFLVRYPRLISPGTVIDDIALNIDVAPTLLELTGQTVPAVSGRSLVPVLRDRDSVALRDRRFLYENYQDPEFPKVTFDILAMRTQRHKVVTYPGHPEWTEVYDLAADPLELYNIAERPDAATARDRLIRALRNRLRDAGLEPVIDPD